MCGLYGFICKPSFTRGGAAKKRFLVDAMYVSALRGMEGTGLAITKDTLASPFVYKKAMPASDFYQLKTSQRIVNSAEDACMVLGHTRSATRGFIDDESAHPFQYGHITLIHNGTVNGLHNSAKGCDIQVDSAQLAYAFWKSGNEKSILEEITGQYCVIWHNSKTGTINIARNNDKPLYWAHIPEWEGLAFMSEYQSLAYVLDRADIKIKDGYWYPLPHHIYSWKINKDGLQESAIPFDPTVTRARGSPTGKIAEIGNNDGNQQTQVTWLPGHTKLGAIETTIRGVDSQTAERAHNRNKNVSVKNRADHSGRPTTDRQIKKATVKLKAVGLKYDTLYGALPTMFEPYKNQREYGYVLLKMLGHFKDFVAELHNIRKAAFDIMVEQDRTVMCRAVNLRTDSKDRVVILELDKKLMDYRLEEAINSKSPNKPDYEVQADDNQIAEVTIDLVIGPENELISTEEWHSLTRNNCTYCGDPLIIEDAKNIKWIDLDPLCSSCGKDETKISQVRNFLGPAGRHDDIH